MKRVPFVCVLMVVAAVSAPEAGQQAQTPPAQQWVEVPPAEHAFHEQAAAYRHDTLDVTVAPGDDLEVDLGMTRGAAIVYSWRVSSPSGARVVSEFHGHTEREPGKPGTLMFYRKANGSAESGSLVAPFDGVHAWYFRNDATTPVVIRLVVSGFYELQSKSNAIVSVP